MADDTKKTATPVTDEIATTRNDPDIFAGYLNRLENPDPVLNTEAYGKGIRLYDEVDRDPHAGSVLQTRYMSVAGSEWEILPGEDTAAAKQVAALVEKAIKGCNFVQFVAEIMQAVLYGHYEAEVMWQVKDGDVLPAKIMGKHPRRFVFTPERELRMLTLASLIEGEKVPDRKFVTFSYGSSDNPYGKGLGQKLWWPVWFKKNGIKFWLIFLEKFGMPTIVGTYPSGTLPEQQTALMAAIESIQSDSGVKIPEGMALNLLEASRSGNVTHESLCDYMDRQMSKAVLGQTLTTEVSGTGSYAASQTHDEVRSDIRTADTDMVCECLNATLVPWIVDYNFANVPVYPKLRLRTEADPDPAERVEVDKTLVTDIGLPVARRYFYDTYNVPEPGAGDDLVQPAVKAPGMAGAFSEAALTPAQQAIEGLTHKAMAHSADVMAGISGPVKALLAKSTSLEDFRDNLYAAFSDLDPAALEDLLARAMFAAEMHGRAGIEAKMKKDRRQYEK
jgi:phage gp29-like protein